MSFIILCLLRRNQSLRSLPIQLGMLHAMNQVILQPYSISNHLKCCRTHHRTFGLSIQEPPTIWFHWISHVSLTIQPTCQAPTLSRGSTGTPKSLASVLLRSPHQMGASWCSATSSTHLDYLIPFYLLAN